MGSRCESRPPLLSCWLGLYSPHGTRDAAFLSNYAYINLNDPSAGPMAWAGRGLRAGQYAMRLWKTRINWPSWAHRNGHY